MVQSVINGVEKQTAQNLRRKDVLEEIKVTFMKDIGYYSTYIDMEKTDPILQLNDYIRKGKFNTGIADLILIITSKVLKVKIIILQEEKGKYIIKRPSHDIINENEKNMKVYIERRPVSK